jgi:hypothetical protein
VLLKRYVFSVAAGLRPTAAHRVLADALDEQG